MNRCRAQSTSLARMRGLLLLGLVATMLAACGGDDGGGAQIQWIEGTPPPEYLAQFNGGAQPTPSTQPTETVESAPDSEPTPTTEPEAEPTDEPTEETESPETQVTGVKLSAEQLDEYQPNELGLIPVLEYHVFTTDPAEEAQFTRTIDDFKADLQWLYDNDFYVVPLRDMVLNEIRAPAGKKPVVLTFDDSTAGQFRYLIADDGTVTIDPDSAVGVMEEFYAAHPDFGRGGFFAVRPSASFCFSWQLEEREDDQNEYCGQKLTWLLDNGYEVGNHTRNHTDLLDVDDDTFRDELSGAIIALQEYDPRIEANILAMPFGNYPDLETKQQQREWLKNGFSWDGEDYLIIGSLMVGSNPTESPNSTEYDSMWIARIQAFDEDAEVKDANGELVMDMMDWFDIFESEPERLYVSDGDPNTITVPDDLPLVLDGTLDTDRVEALGKELVRY
ncbi:MAG: polysaccharide deacetylase family protein [Thermomicrobiales bacterium]|nr:polysaccharide deacetylase family protein [Thermomicrobiales bacterium]